MSSSIQTIQLSISTQISSMWPIVRTLPSATTPSQSGPETDRNRRVHCIPQSSSATPFSGLLHFTLDTYLILLSVKQGGIKYHFKSLWYDVNLDWTQVSRTIGEHSTHKATEPVNDMPLNKPNQTEPINRAESWTFYRRTIKQMKMFHAIMSTS